MLTVHRLSNLPGARFIGGVLLGILIAISVQPAKASGAEQPWRNDPDTVTARAANGDAAISLYQRLVVKYADVPQLHAELAELLFVSKRYGEAEAAYVRAGELGWKPDLVHVRIAKCLDRQKKYPAAEAEYRVALIAAPDSVAARFGLAAALFNQEKSADAIPLLEALASRDDEWGRYAQEYLAQAYFDVKKFEQSTALARKLVARDPDDPAFSWLLARNLYKSRNFAEAVVLFRLQIGRDPKRAEAARYYVAVCLENLGKYRDAESEYASASRGDSEFNREARLAARRLAGNPYRFVFDDQGGYDTGILSNDANGNPTKQKDGFNQIFVDVEGRVLHHKAVDLWVGAEHYSILYPRVTKNDYVSDAGKIVAELPNVGPFRRVNLQYALRYSQLDAVAYRYEHRFDAGAQYVQSIHQIYFGVSTAVNSFFHDSENLSGPDGSIFVDYTLRMPKWEHSFRLHADTTYRWSEDPASERLTERLRMQYRSHVASVVYANLAGTYRRDDFPRSATSTLGQRIDDRWTGELFFDAQVQKHLFVNWSYLYESQTSTRRELNYTRHQVSAGVTVTF